jgi:hypothetical protein
LEFRNVDFYGGRKTGGPGQKPSWQGKEPIIPSIRLVTVTAYLADFRAICDNRGKKPFIQSLVNNTFFIIKGILNTRLEIQHIDGGEHTSYE